ncbi:hypothetical protein Q3G72_020034 [Acer saccharum]|nr:hypothetical protein Q3G72_020034 [Acer saccharum]
MCAARVNIFKLYLACEHTTWNPQGEIDEWEEAEHLKAKVPLKAGLEFLVDVGRVEPCRSLKHIEFLQNISFFSLSNVDSS